MSIQSNYKYLSPGYLSSGHPELVSGSYSAERSLIAPFIILKFT